MPQSAKIIKTGDLGSIKPFIEKLYLPQPDSHKGQNGRVLIIGGSSLFHAASIWAAEVASHFVDIVHYSSTLENNEIFLSLKKKFINGIVVGQKDLPCYVDEDDAILVGPGMIRTEASLKLKAQSSKFSQILEMKDEAEYTFYLTKYLIENFPNKKFVFDAGALQMMKKEWLLNLKIPPILTPHQSELKRLFGIDVSKSSAEEKQRIVQKLAKEYHCVILVKGVGDIVSDGERVVIIEGGNPGLTKGGTGDVLAGLAVSFYAKNSPLESGVLASFLLKKTADRLSKTKGYWYNIDDIIKTIPDVLREQVFDKG